ncbi:hypothetical protein ZWY2020_038614 [Hordeum vulgare]|nr:hypothetical protein ZWY2020_038614 [Hordeum vulgare]
MAAPPLQMNPHGRVRRQPRSESDYLFRALEVILVCEGEGEAAGFPGAGASSRLQHSTTRNGCSCSGSSAYGALD